MSSADAPMVHIVEGWLTGLRDSVSTGGTAAASRLFLADCYWRDLVALTWAIRTVCGQEEIARQIVPALRQTGAIGFSLEASTVSPRLVTRVDTETIEAFFAFETNAGRGRGIVRLCSDAGANRYRAWTLLTALEELKGFEEQVGRRRPTGQSHSRDFRGPNWLDLRREAAAYAGRDPEVVVVGGGQAGLAIAARLSQLKVDTLVVEKHARVGDNWRHRYHALTLHNQVQVNHLPYMPFPPNWPTYIPKDKLANWLEAYAEAMELNVWTGTEFVGGRYDEAERRWSLTMRSRDGSERVLRPRHVVMATGVSGVPVRPAIPSLETFTGRVLHSSEYRDGADWAGQRAIVIGTGNSGHDIAQDLHSSGADVTMVQRSPTLVVNIEPSAQLPYALYGEGLLEDCDLLAASMPAPLARKAHVGFTQRSREMDKPLLDGLEQRGFRLDFGVDGTGWQFKYLTRGGGYYFNVGCSDLIAAGAIRLVQHDHLDSFTAEGARTKSGEAIPADLVVLATGYAGQERASERLFGGEVARRIGPIWGFGDGLELRNMYCRTAQPGLWFIAGSFAQCRIYSKYLGLQLKADEANLIAAAASEPSRTAA
jgi:cation diffusion facilitator CzcD-associated flavoprotein CzcO